MRLFLVLFYWFFLGNIGLVLGQEVIVEDTFTTVIIHGVQDLQEGNIIEQKGRFTQENKAKSSFIDVLMYQSPIYVHTTGPGMLSTAKLDGSSSGHTAVLWEGVNIQSATNGALDVSLLSSNLFNNTSYHRSGYALFANGGISGAIQLEEKKNEDNEIGVYGSSDKNLFVSTRNNWSEDKWHISLNTNLDLYENRYSYVKNKAKYLINGIKDVQNESKQKGGNIIGKVNYKINSKSRLMASLWWQSYKREIPPSKVAQTTHAKQEDNNKRFQLKHTYFNQYWNLKSQFVYFNEYLRYESDLITPSTSRVYTYVVNETLNFKTKNYKHHWLISLSIRKDIADTNFYKSQKTRVDGSLNVSYHYKINGANIFVSSRANSMDWSTPVINASTGIKYKLPKHFSVDLTFNRNHKFPNLNDLYWPNLGNPSLKRELAHTGIVNLHYDKNLKSLALKISLNAHSSHLKDKISWAPDAMNIWRPDNIGEVFMFGFGTDLKISYTISKQIEAQTFWYFNYNKSRILKDRFAINEGSELLYAPNYKLSNISSVSVTDFKFQIESLFVGRRFTSTDNKHIAKPYWIQNISFQKTWNIGGQKLITFIDMKNIWDRDYELVPYFAMPLRSFQVGIKYIN